MGLMQRFGIWAYRHEDVCRFGKCQGLGFLSLPFPIAAMEILQQTMYRLSWCMQTNFLLYVKGIQFRNNYIILSEIRH